MLVFGIDQKPNTSTGLGQSAGYVLNLNTDGPGQDIVHSSQCPTLAVERYDRAHNVHQGVLDQNA